MLVRSLRQMRWVLKSFAQDIEFWGYLDQGLVHLNHHMPLSTGYLKQEAQTRVAFANRASTIVAWTCLALGESILGCWSGATKGR